MTQKTERKLICVPDEDPDTVYTRIPVPDAFEEQGADFLRAKDIEAIASLLIDHYEGQFAHLRKLAIAYAWKRAGGSKHGSATLGKTVKSSGLTKCFSETDFVIWLGADNLRDMEATFWQVEAIVYHELNHIRVEDDKPALRGHDFEGFTKEIEEYGAWSESREMMRVAFGQLPLAFVGGTP